VVLRRTSPAGEPTEASADDDGAGEDGEDGETEGDTEAKAESKGESEGESGEPAGASAETP
jgi:hypothetical protein